MKLFHGGKVTLHAGDCMDVLAKLEPNCIDAVVTDPPYHLTSIVKRFGGENAAPAKTNLNMRYINRSSVSDAKQYVRLTRGFMGKQWDGGDIAFRPELWAEVLRVLKPGGHMVAFGGDRTYHRLAVAIEDSGFEVRHTIAYLYGSGFPKSHNVSQKLADSLPADAQCACVLDCSRKALDFQSDCQSVYDCDDEQPLGGRDIALSDAPSLNDVQKHNPFDLRSDGQGEAQRHNHSYSCAHPSTGNSNCPAERLSINSPEFDNIPFGTQASTSHDELMVERKNRQSTPDRLRSDDDLASSSSGYPSRINPNLPRCSECGKIQIVKGLGTALKPAMELICLARKPLSEGTVAANVLKWGTGAINVDGCRVESGEFLGRNNNARSDGTSYIVQRESAFIDNSTGKGRWPANLVHDGSPEVLAGFPERDGAVSNGASGNVVGYEGGWRGQAQHPGYGDSGSAARFFYTAKADSDDRLGSKHPTVKPVDLMQWLVRLICPKGGLVLDPFAGTGTTGAAAFIEGSRAVLIEREAEYLADIERRMELLLSGPDERSRRTVKPDPIETLPLFGAA